MFPQIKFLLPKANNILNSNYSSWYHIPTLCTPTFHTKSLLMTLVSLKKNHVSFTVKDVIA